jgi:ribosomal protein L31
MMSVHITCSECGSGMEIKPDLEATKVKCDICQHISDVKFEASHMQDELKTCPCCQRKDFYQQKDFNRKLGVVFFVIAAILSIWTYGLSLLALYLIDLGLFRRLRNIAICYNCHTIFRNVSNINEIAGFDHEMNDRIIYAGHDFQGKGL